MTNDNRRRANRVEVGLPVQVYTRSGYVAAEMRDLSRTGLRIRARTKDMGFQATSDLRLAAEGVAACLRHEFAVDLNHERLGPLLQRGVELTRIGLPSDAPEHVELCCEFVEPLSDTDAAYLETELPPVREVVAAWVPDEHLPEDCAGVVTFEPQTPRPVKLPEPEAPKAFERPRQSYRALVGGTAVGTPSTFFCHTDLITAIGVRVRMPRADYGEDVTQAGRILVGRYGRALDLRIVSDAADVWTGPVTVNGIELPREQPDVMLVTLGFGRPLRMSELRDLGLVCQAA